MKTTVRTIRTVRTVTTVKEGDKIVTTEEVTTSTDDAAEPFDIAAFHKSFNEREAVVDKFFRDLQDIFGWGKKRP